MKTSSFLLLPLAAIACAGPLTGGMYFTPAYFPSGGAVPPFSIAVLERSDLGSGTNYGKAGNPGTTRRP